MNQELNKIAFSSPYLQVIGLVPKAKKGDLCEVINPFSYEEEYNIGFTIRNINTQDIYIIVDALQNLEAEYSSYPDLFIGEWKSFDKYFKVLPKDHPDVVDHEIESEYQQKLYAYQNRERYHWIRAWSTVACFLGGLVFLIGSLKDTPINSTALLFSLGMIFSAIVGTLLTDFWHHINNIPKWKQAISWIPVIFGFSFIFLIILLVADAREKKNKPTGALWLSKLGLYSFLLFRYTGYAKKPERRNN